MAKTTLFHIEGREEIYTHVRFGAVARVFEYSVVAEPHKDMIKVMIVPNISLESDIYTDDNRYLMYGDNWGARSDMARRLTRPINPTDYKYRTDTISPSLTAKQVTDYNGGFEGWYYTPCDYVTASELSEVVSMAVSVIRDAIMRMGEYCREIGEHLNAAQNTAVSAKNAYDNRVSENIDAIANLKDLIDNLQQASR